MFISRHRPEHYHSKADTEHACELDAFDLVIVDECFPAGTLIDTPRGQIPIEDLYVGQPVRHALGVGNIEAISSRPAFEIMKLESLLIASITQSC